jgi:hypothetical protein
LNAELNSVASGAGPASLDQLKESAVGFAAAGGALGLAHVSAEAASHRFNASAGDAAPPPGRQSEPSADAAERARGLMVSADAHALEPEESVAARPPARTFGPLSTQEYKLIGEQADPDSPHFGARQYQLDNGETFWQLPNGYIVAEKQG